MKTFSAEALAALASGNVIVTGAVRFGLAAPVGFWGGYGTLAIGADSFTGLGDRGLAALSSGTLGGSEQGAVLTLSGVDPNVAADLDLLEVRGVTAVLYRLLFNGSGSTLLHAGVFLRGRVDSAALEETPAGTSTLRIGIEGSARGLGRRSERMRSDADQRLISATDGGLRRVSFAGQKDVYWGGQPPTRAGAAFGGSGPGQGGGATVGGGLGDGGRALAALA